MVSWSSHFLESVGRGLQADGASGEDRGLEDREFLCNLIEAMYDELPAAKKKRK